MHRTFRYATLAPLWLLLLLPAAVQAQAVVRGRVTSPAAEAVAAAVLTLGDRTAVSDSLGRFHFDDVRPGNYLLRATRIGYAAYERILAITESIEIEIRLTDAPVLIESVTAEGRRARVRFETQAGATTRELSKGELKLIPGLAEADVMRAVESLPGVVSTSDFSSAFNVRGGSADQNLIQLDGIPIYNPFHVAGVFSVFNSDMVERAELLAGGFPAEYGGRVSSVLNVITDLGSEDFNVSGGVSVLATRLAVGGELPANGRFRVGARRSYFDQLLKPFFDFPYYLHDLQLGAELWSSPTSRFSVSGYLGDDVLSFAGVDSFPLQVNWKWGNRVAGAAWTKTLRQGGEIDVRSSYSRFTTSIVFPEFSDTRFSSKMQHGLVRAGITLPRGRHELKFGAEVNRMWYANIFESGGTVFREGNEIAWQPSVYAQTTYRPRQSWLIELGVRNDGFLPNAGEGVAKLSPRVALKHFFADGNVAAKLAAGRYTQFLHSVRDEEFPIGIDVWILSGLRAPHVVSDQVQAGVELFPAEGWYAAIEAYHRRFDGLVTNNFADDPNDDFDDMLAGEGLSYGGDLVVRKDEGALQGFLTLSYLKAWRQFPDFLTGLEDAPPVRYPPIYDRRMEMDVVLRFPLPRGWDGGVRWNFGSGLPYTRAIGSFAYYEYGVSTGQRRRFEQDTTEVGVLLEPRNSSRFPAYHRLDMSIRKTFTKGWGKLTPHLDILNVYNRKNVLFYYYDYNVSPATRSGTSMFPFLPTIGVEVQL